MAELTATIFREYFGGSWSGKITKNGEFQREVIFNWPAPFEMYSSLGIEAGLLVPPNSRTLDDTPQVAISGWHSGQLQVFYPKFQERACRNCFGKNKNQQRIELAFRKNGSEK